MLLSPDTSHTLPPQAEAEQVRQTRKGAEPVSLVQSTLPTSQEHAPKMRRTHYPEETDVCPTCGSPFTPTRGWQRFCSTPCRRKNHRKDTRDMILAGMIDTAKALGYSKTGFLAKIEAIWK